MHFHIEFQRIGVGISPQQHGSKWISQKSGMFVQTGGDLKQSQAGEKETI